MSENIDDPKKEPKKEEIYAPSELDAELEEQLIILE